MRVILIGNTIKLRETPKASFYQVEVETHSMVELTALKKVKMMKMIQWIIRSQVLKETYVL
jgi:phage antirepressor YoqD-like protein